MKPVDITLGLKTVISSIESAGIDYMIVGSIAGTVYGEPRLTNDLDLVVSMSSSSADKFIQAFNPKDFHIPPKEIFSQEITRGGQTNLLHHESGLIIDIMFQKSNPHARSEFARKKRIEILRGIIAWIAAPEDVIIAKLRFYRDGESEKHLIDIRGILANTEVDRSYLDEWIKKSDLTGTFQKV